MKTILALSLSLISLAALAFSPDTTIWLNQPAKVFTESLPLGNGRLGAMDFGGITNERVVLNEDSLWSGSVQKANRTNAAAALPEIRKLLLEGKNHQAEALVNSHFTCAGAGSGRGLGANLPYGAYQVLGNLRLKCFYSGAHSVKHYRRELDLTTATGTTSFSRDGIKYTREIFVSHPDQVIVLRLTASRPGQISFEATMDRPARFHTVVAANNQLLMTGAMTNGAGGRGVKYAARLEVLAHGGTVSARRGKIVVKGADSALLLVTAETNYKRFAQLSHRNVAAAAAKDLKRAVNKNFTELLTAHIADYQSLFDRVKFSLGGSVSNVSREPTPDRIAARDLAKDPSLAVLYFNFGRYLLISSSRPGGMPANLQGLWAVSVQPPWNADYHLNINLEMIYWPANVCNLSELEEPLIAYIESLQKPGEKTAWDYYHAHGWVAHVLGNAWGFTAPGESASWGSTASDTAWLCHCLWEHWRFTGNTNYLRQIYPVMRGAAKFFCDMLIPYPSHNWLVTAPANSPENTFIMPDGKPAQICVGPTYDDQLLRFLFGACIKASKILGKNPAFAAELQAKRKRLPPTRIGRDGRIMEWLKEYKEQNPHHRDTSHLWGLYPGHQISVAQTPALAAAARKTLIARGDKTTGWATAFRMGMWARLHNGNHAFKLLQNLIKPATKRKPHGPRWTGGCYPNLFDAHPPFQIDGNMGGTEAITELLLQSQDGDIDLLPALPSAWPTGKISGLCARGGYQVGVKWNNGKLVFATVKNVSGTGNCQVVYGTKSIELHLQKGETQTVNLAQF